MPAEQRRGRKIAMDKAELDAFLAGERTCRLATSSPQGPHLTALWFAWDGAAVWIYSTCADALVLAKPSEVGVAPPFVPGSELAGQVLAVGAEVTGLKAGDLVFGT